MKTIKNIKYQISNDGDNIIKNIKYQISNDGDNTMKNIKYQISNDRISSPAGTQTFSIFYLLFVIERGALL